MRVLRFLTLLALVSTFASAWSYTTTIQRALRPSTSQSRRRKQRSGRQEVAAGLVDTAVSRRAEIESELAVSITRISDLSAELSAVSSDLDGLKAQIAHGDAELTGIEADIETHAVDAYMDALVGRG